MVIKLGCAAELRGLVSNPLVLRPYPKVVMTTWLEPGNGAMLTSFICRPMDHSARSNDEAWQIGQCQARTRKIDRTSTARHPKSLSNMWLEWSNIVESIQKVMIQVESCPTSTQIESSRHCSTRVISTPFHIVPYCVHQFSATILQLRPRSLHSAILCQLIPKHQNSFNTWLLPVNVCNGLISIRPSGLRKNLQACGSAFAGCWGSIMYQFEDRNAIF